jgi:hypothetical protein
LHLLLVDNVRAIEIAMEDYCAAAKLSNMREFKKKAADNLYQCATPGAKKLALDFYLSAYQAKGFFANDSASAIENKLYDIASILYKMTKGLMNILCGITVADETAAEVAGVRCFFADDVVAEELFFEVHKTLGRIYRAITERTTNPIMSCKSIRGLYAIGATEMKDEIVGYYARALSMLGETTEGAGFAPRMTEIYNAVRVLVEIGTPKALGVIMDFVNNPGVAVCEKRYVAQQLHANGKVKKAVDSYAAIAQQCDAKTQYDVVRILIDDVKTPEAMDLAVDLLVRIAGSAPELVAAELIKESVLNLKSEVVEMLCNIARQMHNATQGLSLVAQRRVLRISKKACNSAMNFAPPGAQRDNVRAELRCVKSKLKELAEAQRKVQKEARRKEEAQRNEVDSMLQMMRGVSFQKF